MLTLFWILFWILVVALATPLLLRLLVAPLLVYRNQYFPGRYVLPAQDLAAFLHVRGAAFLFNHQQLLELGFKPVGASGFAMSHSTSSMIIYRRDEDLLTASLLATSQPNGELAVMEFNQLHADGVALGVNNSPIPGVYPPWWRRRSYRLRGVTDAATLLDRFQAIRARMARTDVVPLPAGEELQTIANYMNDELQAMTERGFLRPADPDGKARLSLRGAYQACWKLSWPFKPMLDARDLRQARAAAA